MIYGLGRSRCQHRGCGEHLTLDLVVGIVRCPHCKRFSRLVALAHGMCRVEPLTTEQYLEARDLIRRQPDDNPLHLPQPNPPKPKQDAA